MSLLFLLAARPGEVFTKDEIMAAVWPGVIVGDDTLRPRRVAPAQGAATMMPKHPLTSRRCPSAATASSPRCARPKRSRERRATAARTARACGPGRSPQQRRRSPCPCACGRSAIWQPASDAHATLVERANDFYFQYTRADNEAAIALFQRILTERPDYAPALAGLANALVQNVIRWPDDAGGRVFTSSATLCTDSRMKHAGRHAPCSPRARVLAERAVALAPDDAAAQKALGLRPIRVAGISGRDRLLPVAPLRSTPRPGAR